MPWWAIAYLILLSLVILVSLIKDYRDGRSLSYISGELVSGSIGFALIYLYYHPQLLEPIGLMIIPLLIYAIVWDQFALSKLRKSAYADLTEEENRDMDRYSKLFAFLFILPCYISGLLISWRIIVNG